MVLGMSQSSLSGHASRARRWKCAGSVECTASSLRIALQLEFVEARGPCKIRCALPTAIVQATSVSDTWPSRPRGSVSRARSASRMLLLGSSAWQLGRLSALKNPSPCTVQLRFVGAAGPAACPLSQIFTTLLQPPAARPSGSPPALFPPLTSAHAAEEGEGCDE